MTIHKHFFMGFALAALLSATPVFSQTIIRGNILIDHDKLAAFGDTLRLHPVASVSLPELQHLTIKIPVEEDGTFYYETDKIQDSILFQYHFYWFPEILLIPNTEYNIEADALNVEDTYKVNTNPSGGENEYLATHRKSLLRFPDASLEPGDYAVKLDSILKNELEFLEAFDLSPGFKSMMADKIRFQCGERIFNYIVKNDMDLVQARQSGLFEFLDQIPLQNDRTAPVFTTQLSLIDTYLRFLEQGRIGEERPSLMQMSRFAGKYFQGKTLEAYLARNFLIELRYSNVFQKKELEEFLDHFKKSYPDSKYTSGLEIKFGDRIENIFNLSVFDKNFDIEIYDTSGKPLKIGNVFVKNLGKVIYLDIWGSWCKPCIAQIPALKRLRKHFEEKDFIIISVSTEGKNYSGNWKKAIIDHDWEDWNHYLTEGGYDSLLSVFDSNIVPTYVLIDKNGRVIVNFGQPDDEDLIRKIKAVL